MIFLRGVYHIACQFLGFWGALLSVGDVGWMYALIMEFFWTTARVISYNLFLWIYTLPHGV